MKVRVSPEEAERAATALEVRVAADLAAVARGAARRLGRADATALAELPTAITDWYAHVQADQLPLVGELFAHGTAEVTERTRPAGAAEHAGRDYLAGASNRLRGIGDELWAAIRAALLDGIAHGEGVEELARRVRSAAGVAAPRALNIARTEAVGASVAGADAAIMGLGAKGTKTWLAVHDDRTRPEHRDADGQTVGIGEAFEVGGFPMRRPHDPFAPAHLVINCRCTLAYDLADDWVGTVIAAAEVPSGAMLALVPADPDALALDGVPGAEPAEDLHLTLAFLGDAAAWPPAARASVEALASQLAGVTPPIDGEAFGAGHWNTQGGDREPSWNLQVGGAALDNFHEHVSNALLELDEQAELIPDQHRPWVAHVCLAYSPDPGLAEQVAARAGELPFDRLRVAFGDQVTDYPLAAAAVASARHAFHLPGKHNQQDHAGGRHRLGRRHGMPLSSMLADDLVQRVGLDPDTAWRINVVTAALGDRYGPRISHAEWMPLGTDPDVIAGMDDKGTLYVNPFKLNERTLVRAVAKGNTAHGDDTIEGVITHEYGHRLLKGPVLPRLVADAKADAWEAAYANGYSDEAPVIAAELSRYAASDPDELEAEMFSNYHFGGDDRPPWVIAWGKELDYRLGLGHPPPLGTSQDLANAWGKEYDQPRVAAASDPDGDQEPDGEPERPPMPEWMTPGFVIPADDAPPTSEPIGGSGATREAFHLPGKHNQQDHAGRRHRRLAGRGISPITALEARGNSRPVTAEEFQRIAEEGEARLRTFRSHQSPPDELDRNWDAVRTTAYAETRKSWGGATFDAHTGRTVQPTDGYALSIKAHADSVSIAEEVDRAGFDRAMDRARRRFRKELSMERAHLGVFHDDDERRIDIDPVLVVDSLQDVETIGAATHAIGGAYSFADGNGYWPPHVGEAVAAAAGEPADGHWRGLGEWYAYVRSTQHAGQAEPPATTAAGEPAFHLPGGHNQKAHGGKLGRQGLGRPGMGDIPLTKRWVDGFQGGSAAPFLVRNPDGSARFTPERQQLHDRIVLDILAGKHPPEGRAPAYHVLGGGPASGKTSLVNSDAGTELRDPNVALIGLDEIRAQLPEYRERIATDPTVAPYSHEESAYLTARAQAAAAEAGLDMTLDTTGDSDAATMDKKLKRARAAGYQVKGHYVTVPIETAMQRANARGKQTGRYVPRAGLTAIHAAVSRTLPAVLQDFDQVELFDNRGETPTPVMHWDGHTMTVDDQQLWQEFLDKAAAAPADVDLPEGAALHKGEPV